MDKIENDTDLETLRTNAVYPVNESSNYPPKQGEQIPPFCYGSNGKLVNSAG